MKNLFIINEEEKNRILNLHETATKRHYLNEQEIKQGPYGDPYQYKKVGNDYYYAPKKGGTWTKATKDDAIKDIKNNIFNVSDTILPKQEKWGSKSKIPNNFKEINRVVGDTTYDTGGVGRLKTQSEKNLKQAEEDVRKMGKMSKKVYNQIKSMMVKGTLKNETFIVVNKDSALAVLFGPNYEYLTKSSIVTGRDKDIDLKDESKLGYREWMSTTLDYIKRNPNSKDANEVKKFIEANKSIPGLVKPDGTIDIDTYEKNKNNLSPNYMSHGAPSFPFSYAARNDANQDITPGGFYKLGKGRVTKGYAANTENNTFPLIKYDTGEKLPNALHGYSDKKRGDLIKQYKKQGVDLNKEGSRIGAGCVNVDEKFIDNVNKHNPGYVLILPDTGKLVNPKIVTFDTWSDKIASAEKCFNSFISMFA